MKIAILLSTYNGAQYLRSQIDSIIAQNNHDWTLYIRDDGSKDETTSIITEYQAKYPSQIQWFNQNHIVNCGVIGSFFELLLGIDADYYMFCDQDDVWLPEKVALTITKMQQVEAGQLIRPALVHTDLRVVDQNLDVQSESMMATQSLDPQPSFNRLLVQNSITGCTMMVNHALKQRVVQSDDRLTIMHDWWLALIASSFGVLGYVAQPTMLYRQHGNNAVGAKSMWKEAFTREHLFAKSKESVALSIEQATQFAKRFPDLPESLQAPLHFYTHVRDYPRAQRRRLLNQYGLAKSGGLRDVFFRFLIWNW